MNVVRTAAVEPYSDTPYRRGYRTPPRLRQAVAEAHGTRLWRTGAQALFDQLSVPCVLLAAASPGVRGSGWGVCLLALAAAVLASARQLRGLENLIHEASHYNWSRNRRRVGDALASVLGSLPTGARMTGYRAGHLVHHGRFGTSADPDRRRYEALGLEDLDRGGFVRYALGVARRFGSYQAGWLRNLGSAPTAAALPFAWCLAEIFLPGWLIGGPWTAFAAGAGWLVTQLIALPALRFVAESSEHVYRGTRTVFDATVSNLGFVQRVFIHPHGDGYHTIHHMWPGVPHHRIARLHRLLLAQDDRYRRDLRYRMSVLCQPTVGWDRGRQRNASSPSRREREQIK